MIPSRGHPYYLVYGCILPSSLYSIISPPYNILYLRTCVSLGYGNSIILFSWFRSIINSSIITIKLIQLS
ncbi:hypothetical protein A1Q2_08520 (mitochondrion) [Trichosporon asahii var. asahii CBS 8904]|uniref:Uncharacterized protein n=1 Tax=Trichosporon asahii var. asahii (strain CBS 8904) TaxID=1220162 RepID=K1VK88_TRIAC|nr:hypothetical protein A1Q2_08520 [Trichosporon asahii var. asahii CBS 8904]